MIKCKHLSVRKWEENDMIVTAENTFQELTHKKIQKNCYQIA